MPELRNEVGKRKNAKNPILGLGFALVGAWHHAYSRKPAHEKIYLRRDER